MRVSVVCGHKELAQAFARRMQREFAAHGIASETDALTPQDVRGSAGSYDVHVLAPEVAFLEREVAASCRARVWVMPPQDFRRLNTKKVANDIALLMGA